MKRSAAVLALTGTLLLVYSLLRIIFYLLYFFPPSPDAPSLLRVFYWGLRLDFTALFVINLPFLLYFFVLHGRLPSRTRRRTGLIVFLLSNLPFLAINILDLAYYRFILRRSNAGLLYVWTDSVPALLSSWLHWLPYFAGFVMMSLVLALIVRHILDRSGHSAAPGNRRVNVLTPVLLLGLGLLAARGLGSRPILPSTPLLYFPPPYQPLVSNSTLSVLYSLLKPEALLPAAAEGDRPLVDDSVFCIRRQFARDTITKKNLVVFIMESISRASLDPSSPLKAKTPFLDSLMSRSLVCTNALANGFQSNEGIVAILGSIPPFFDVPYYYSAYANNRVRGVGELLREEGYTTSFFMGAEFDHFGFAKMTSLVGIDHYYSGDDYQGGSADRGGWGVHDGPFLQYMATALRHNGAAKPFLAVQYNLSTHYPYQLPAGKNPLVKAQSPAQNSLTYLDDAYRRFFETICHEDWYKNTIFVFCADHWSGDMNSPDFNRSSAFHIPFFIHMPGAAGGRLVRQPVQQLDLVPTVLDLVGYPKPFMSFGTSIFDTGARYAYNRYAGTLQVSDSVCLLGYDEERQKPVYLYDYTSDRRLARNLVDNPSMRGRQEKLVQQARAFRAVFNRAVVNNDLYVK